MIQSDDLYDGALILVADLRDGNDLPLMLRVAGSPQEDDTAGVRYVAAETTDLGMINVPLALIEAVYPNPFRDA